MMMKNASSPKRNRSTSYDCAADASPVKPCKAARHNNIHQQKPILLAVSADEEEEEEVLNGNEDMVSFSVPKRMLNGFALKLEPLVQQSGSDVASSARSTASATAARDATMTAAQARPRDDTVTLEPRETDILFGPGVPKMNHPGNVHFRQLVEDSFDIYSAASKLGKRPVAAKVVQRIRQANGRFLNQGSGGVWHDIGDRKAIAKTQQRFRDCKAEKERVRAAPVQSEAARPRSPTNSGTSHMDVPHEPLRTAAPNCVSPGGPFSAFDRPNGRPLAVVNNDLCKENRTVSPMVACETKELCPKIERPLVVKNSRGPPKFRGKVPRRVSSLSIQRHKCSPNQEERGTTALTEAAFTLLQLGH